MLKQRFTAAGLDSSKYSAHKLRHTAATLMLQNGVDVRTLQEVLGHEHLNTTQIYTQMDSEALQNQKSLIREYIQGQKDLKMLSIFEDNGETGTNFQRPGFEEMMGAVYAGKANCIVVKDLSRFGRNYIEAGNYLDHVFPSMGVRFISIGDGYDSAGATTADCLVVALKNLMNQVYSKDISRKSGSVLREKIEQGGVCRGLHQGPGR